MLRGPAWSEAVAAAGRAGGLRSDGLARLEAVAAALLDAAQGGATAAPTWPALVEALGCDRSTVARWLKWLRRERLLVAVEHGSTAQFRPKAMEVEGNRAAVYLLTTPAPSGPGPVTDAVHASGSTEDATPQASLPWERRRRPPHARESARTRASEALVAAGKGTTSREEPGRRAGERDEVVWGPRATRRREQLAIAVGLRGRALDLRAISAAAVCAVIRPFLDAGWVEADLVHAIDHTPDGVRRTFTSGPALPARYEPDDEEPRPMRRAERVAAPVASPGAWLAWRLRPWAGHQPPAAARRAAQVAARAHAARAAAARRAEHAAVVAAAVPAPGSITAARQVLRERTGVRPRQVRRPWTPAP